MVLNRSTGNPGQHPIIDRGFDFYPTPLVAVEALLNLGLLPSYIWEPACGSGSIVTPLRDVGKHVWASDITDWKCPDTNVHDFFDFGVKFPAPYCEAIVTNPPYNIGTEFVEHALSLCPQVFMLLRLAFLESERRSPIIDTGRLHTVYVFRKRLPRMHRQGWSGKKNASSAIAFAWFHWGPPQEGPTRLYRI